jgi:phytanoyl-CoA hydroxylase
MPTLIRRIKLFYSVYNFFHPAQLRHNLPQYKRWGLRKFYFSPVSSKDFAGKEASADPEPEIFRSEIQKLPVFQSLNEASKQSLLAFPENGFAILSSFFTKEEVETVHNEIEKLLKDGKVAYNAAGKIMFAIHHSEPLRKLGEKQELLDILGEIMGKPARLFQSINFDRGSQQPSHSDSIHMTTQPKGLLSAAWVALEKIHKGSGELHYYPGSHKLPYYMNADYDNEGNFWLIGDKPYRVYEEMLAGKISSADLKKETFLPEAGDVLIWHANLIHGGEPVTNSEYTRKSMVFHYFGEGAICYHEITQRPALLGKSSV